MVIGGVGSTGSLALDDVLELQWGRDGDRRSPLLRGWMDCMSGGFNGPPMVIAESCGVAGRHPLRPTLQWAADVIAESGART